MKKLLFAVVLLAGCTSQTEEPLMHRYIWGDPDMMPGGGSQGWSPCIHPSQWNPNSGSCDYGTNEGYAAP